MRSDFPGRMAFLFIILGLPAIFSACKKNDSSAVHQRMTGSTFSYHDLPAMHNVLKYTGNLLTEGITYDSSMAEISRATIQYSGSTMTSVHITYKAISAWTQPTTYEVTWLDGGKPLDITVHYYSQTGVESSREKFSYIYESRLLTRVNESTWAGNGLWIPSGFTAYFYDTKGRVIREQGDTSNLYAQVTTYSYDATHRTEMLLQVYFSGSYTNEQKTVYHYDGDRLASAITYFWESGSWVQKELETYTYNESGNLVKDRLEGTFFATQEVDYQYSDGSGNFSQYVAAVRGKLILPGDPTPLPAKGLFTNPEYQVDHR